LPVRILCPLDEPAESDRQPPYPIHEVLKWK
jgi:hypothetical protein